MARLNDRAAAPCSPTACTRATDITGYGLVGHGGEMARASGVAWRSTPRAVPLFDGVLELVAQGVVPGGSQENLADHARFVEYAEGVDAALRTVLSDAQTSGGLLIAISPEGAERVLAELGDLGGVAIVGEVLAGPPGAVLIR